ncbi:MAG: thymidylate synthase [Chryseobacterium sp.]|nr:MAG: thymidylate synthase [Chryseobacterium sp.]
MKKRTVDEQYKELIKTILDNGFDYEDPNRKGVIRKQIPHFMIELDGNTSPILTLKRVYPKLALNELKSFIAGDNTLQEFHDRHIKYWDKDVYRWNKEKKLIDEDITFEEFLKDVEEGFLPGLAGDIYSVQMNSFNGCVDQIDTVIKNLKNNPNSTKNTVTMWNPETNANNAACLSSCHWAFEFIVSVDSNGYNVLNLMWHQHSVDTFLGLPMNIMYYYFMLNIAARYLGMKVGTLYGNLTNVHLYDNTFEFSEIIKKSHIVHKAPNIVFEKQDTNKPFKQFVEDASYYIDGSYKYNEDYKVEMLTYSK